MRNSSSPDKIIVDRSRPVDPSWKAMKDQRKRLTASTGQPVQYENELLRGFAENQQNIRLAMPIMTVITAVVAGFWIDLIAAIFWGALTLMGYMHMATLSKRFLNEPPAEVDVSKWRRKFLFGQILIGMAWAGYAAYGCYSCGNSQYDIIQFSTILVFQAVTAMSTYSLHQGLLTTAAPATLILSGRFMFSYEPGSMMMAGTACLAMVFFYLIANRFKVAVLALLDHNAERETLIGELETEKSVSEEARRRAEEANLAKSRFLATMSHELRTPLNAILGFSEVMRDEVLGPIGVAPYKDYVRDIHQSGSHLLNLINEILDISRIEAGKHDLNEEALSLVNAAEEACHMFQLKAKNKGVTLVTQYQENLPQIWADERGIRQILLNLLSNALKFTPNGGTITLKVGWTSRGGQYLSIKDTGPGIPEEEIPIVLSSFGQGSIAIKSAEQGTGLGLPIVQALVHMHEGRFTLTSKLRQGTEVTASFPKARVLEVMEPLQAKTNLKSKPSSSRGLKHAS